MGETSTLGLPDGGYLAETAAIGRYLDLRYGGRKLTGETPLRQGQDVQWDNRIWVQILYRIVTMFHAMHAGLGFEFELTHNPAWGGHSRKEALRQADLVSAHLPDGRDRIPGGDEPTFAGITLVTAIASPGSP